MSTMKFRVLLTNDDGPPGPDSPYIFGFYRHLVNVLGWDVKVVIPSSQKSWIGGAFQIKDLIRGQYFYPRDPDGLGETSPVSRALKDGEFAEWVLFDGTPATCTNIALHNIYPGEIDFVVSGPNLGRNSSAAFALSSGTVGAALSAALSKTRAVAVSYGTVRRLTPRDYFVPAHELSGRIIQRLFQEWGPDVDVYNVNVPMIEGLLAEGGMPVAWTTLWRNSYARLFARHSTAHSDKAPGAPDAQLNQVATQPSLTFKFAPDFHSLINPSVTPVGSDAWALDQGWASVTPLNASFAEAPAPPAEPLGSVDDAKVWRFKL